MPCYLVVTGLGSLLADFSWKSGQFLPKSSGHTVRGPGVIRRNDVEAEAKEETEAEPL